MLYYILEEEQTKMQWLRSEQVTVYIHQYTLVVWTRSTNGLIKLQRVEILVLLVDFETVALKQPRHPCWIWTKRSALVCSEGFAQQLCESNLWKTQCAGQLFQSEPINAKYVQFERMWGCLGDEDDTIFTLTTAACCRNRMRSLRLVCLIVQLSKCRCTVTPKPSWIFNSVSHSNQQFFC